MKTKIIEWILGHQKVCLILSTLFIISFLPGFAYLKTDFSYRAWYEDSDPILIKYDKFESHFGNDDNIVIGLFNDNGLLNSESLRTLYEISQEMWKIKGIVRVDSLINHSYVKSDVESIETNSLITEEDLQGLNTSFITNLDQKISELENIESYLISKDRKLAIIRAKVLPSLKASNGHYQTIKDTKALIKKFENEKSEYKYLLVGTATFMTMFKDVTIRDFTLIIPILLIIFVLLLYYLYRKYYAIILGMTAILTTIVVSVGFTGYFGFGITQISSATPVILLTLALADFIHILTVYYFCVSQGNNSHQAMRYSLNKNFYPTILTTLTTSIGFFSFSNSAIKTIAHLGTTVGFGVIVAWFLTFFLIAPLILLKKVEGTNEEFKIEDNKLVIKEKTKTFIRLIFKYKYIIFICALITFFGSIKIASKLEVNINPNSQFRDSHPYVMAFKKIEDHLGDLAQIEMSIDSGKNNGAKNPDFLKKVDIFNDWLINNTSVSQVISLIDIIKHTNQILQSGEKADYTIPKTQYETEQALFFYSLGLPVGQELNDKISSDGKYLRTIGTWSTLKSKEAIATINHIESEAHKQGLNLSVTGKMPIFHSLTPYVVESFVQSFVIALIAIFITLIIVLKSLKLGLLALIPNIFPIAVGAAAYSFTGFDIDMVSVMIVAVCLGIAVDDSIHFMFEYKKFRNLNKPQEEIFQLIFTNTVPSLMNTTILIAVGFSSLLLAEYLPSANYGIMVSFTLIIALIADILLLPACLIIFDKK